jgi:vacuolar-type H+-ATPase subunit D/Vma8
VTGRLSAALQIQIYLGDQQTAAVGRAKIAKSKLTSVEA